jgi:hypothetical protein
MLRRGVLTQTVRRRLRWTRMSWRCRRLFGPGRRWAWMSTASTEVAGGGIPWRLGIFTPAEVALLDADHHLALLPERSPTALHGHWVRVRKVPTLGYPLMALLSGFLAWLQVFRITCLAHRLLPHMSHQMSHESTMWVWLRHSS